MIDREQTNLLTLVQGHSSVIITGFPLVGVLRAIETALQIQEGQVTPEFKIRLLRGDHPDFIIRDGRDLKLEELRDLVQDATVLPAVWDKKYLLLYYLDHAYHSSYSTLLKLIEEPPAHLSTIIATGFIRRIPDTVRSRSLMCSVSGLSTTELSWWLDFKGKTDHQDLRFRTCGGDPELAEFMVVTFLKEWSECWDTFIAGIGELNTNFLTIWGDRFKEMDDLTQLAYWHLLGSLLSKKLVSHPLWLEIGNLAFQARNMIRNGELNKQQSSVFLIRLYALARTVKNRTKVKAQ